MPFFPEPLKKRIEIKKQVTLQVRIPLKKCGFCGKRVLFFASHNYKKKWIFSMRGSLTVEAALALPLFLFAMVILMTPMKLMNEHRKLQTALEAAGEKASQYAYVLYQLEQDEGTFSLEALGEAGAGMTAGLSQAGILLYADHKVREACDSRAIGRLSLIRSKVLEDGETIDLVVDYELKLPFPVFRLQGIPMTARSCRRAWVGREGGVGMAGESAEDKKDEIVYIGKTSTRYHRSNTCHYLYNNIEAVSYDDIGAIRNAGRKKYHACSRCGGGAGKGSTVYVMPSGESYHSDRYCSAIIAFVEAVPLSSVEYMGACFYCSK